MKVESDKLLDSREQQKVPGEQNTDPKLATSWKDMINTPNAPMIRRPNVDKTVREYMFVRTYRCKNCGYEWSEKIVRSVDEEPR